MYFGCTNKAQRHALLTADARAKFYANASAKLVDLKKKKSKKKANN